MTEKQILFGIIAAAAVVGQHTVAPTNYWEWTLLVVGTAGAVAGTLKSLSSNPNLPLKDNPDAQTISVAVEPVPLPILPDPTTAPVSQDGPSRNV